VDQREDGTTGKSIYPLDMLYQFVGVKTEDVGKTSELLNMLGQHLDMSKE
jgi:hypothetical protein